jgi:hypothetical protein
VLNTYGSVFIERTVSLGLEFDGIEGKIGKNAVGVIEV